MDLEVIVVVFLEVLSGLACYWVIWSFGRELGFYVEIGFLGQFFIVAVSVRGEVRMQVRVQDFQVWTVEVGWIRGRLSVTDSFFCSVFELRFRIRSLVRGGVFVFFYCLRGVYLACFCSDLGSVGSEGGKGLVWSWVGVGEGK